MMWVAHCLWNFEGQTIAFFIIVEISGACHFTNCIGCCFSSISISVIIDLSICDKQSVIQWLWTGKYYQTGILVRSRRVNLAFFLFFLALLVSFLHIDDQGINKRPRNQSAIERSQIWIAARQRREWYKYIEGSRFVIT